MISAKRPFSPRPVGAHLHLRLLAGQGPAEAGHPRLGHRQHGWVPITVNGLEWSCSPDVCLTYRYPSVNCGKARHSHGLRPPHAFEEVSCNELSLGCPSATSSL